MRIKVIGVHLPRLDQSGLSAFIRESVSSFQRTLRELRSQGITKATDEEIESRSEELPEELNADLQKCALVEVEVTGNAEEFDPADFKNPETGSIGWEPTFLSMDGEAVLTESYKAPASLKDFRVVFYLHEWGESGSLVGPTGTLPIPAVTPVPARLWRLAPYSCVD